MATYASIKYDMDLSSNATGAGGMTLLSTQTASSSANVTFDSGINSTYKSYVFKFFDIHPATDNVKFQVNFRDGSTAYDATKTTSFFQAYHDEAGTTTALSYNTGLDLAQGTGVTFLTGDGQGNGNDEALSGMLELFDPSTTTFVKHFMCTLNSLDASNTSINNYVAGYCNVTAAIDGVQFTMSSGNIDAGTIKMYGVS
tara:strand:- start:13 stop:609 length:597 start_codon:yes stop_codon:yes gene_type:complete